MSSRIAQKGDLAMNITLARVAAGAFIGLIAANAAEKGYRNGVQTAGNAAVDCYTNQLVNSSKSGSDSKLFNYFGDMIRNNTILNGFGQPILTTLYGATGAVTGVLSNFVPIGIALFAALAKSGPLAWLPLAYLAITTAMQVTDSAGITTSGYGGDGLA